ncbi:MAG TPA: signal peptidase II [Actinomycetota bacterium]
MVGLLILVAGIVLALDQATKVIVVASMLEGQTIPVIDGVLHWTFQRNPGAAFGLFTDFPVAFTILASAIAVGILVYARRVPDRTHAVALGLVLGGAVGNLTDRVFRPPGVFRGHVIDFVDLRVWPVFNVADAAVVVGAILLILAQYAQERRARAARG